MAILSPDLKNQKSNQTLLIDKKYSFEEQLATYLSIAVWEELERFLANDRVPFGCPDCVSVLGVGLSSLTLLPPRRLLICTTKAIHQYCLYEISYGHTETWLINQKTKRANKCLAVKDYS